MSHSSFARILKFASSVVNRKHSFFWQTNGILGTFSALLLFAFGSTHHQWWRFAGVCTYHLSKCMLISFSGSFGGNMVGRICVWRLLGTSDQSENHWPSLVISCGDKLGVLIFSPQSKNSAGAHVFIDGFLFRQPKTKHFKYLPGSDPRHPLQAGQIGWAVSQLQRSWMWLWESNYNTAGRKKEDIVLDTLLISTTLIIQTVNPGSMASWKRNLKQDKDHSGGRRGPFVSRVFLKKLPQRTSWDSCLRVLDCISTTVSRIWFW